MSNANIGPLKSSLEQYLQPWFLLCLEDEEIVKIADVIADISQDSAVITAFDDFVDELKYIYE